MLKYRHLNTSIVLVLMMLVLVSCEKKNDTPEINYDYLYDYELLLTSSKQQVLATLALASFKFPDLSEVIPEVESGVEVYKVVYNTQFQGEIILASGLVCVPKGKREYPLLSFQNGTNTCHIKAPSENATDTLFTLISGMAGTGFVVTIPDYIGFGESDNILHPYHHTSSNNSAVIDLLKASEELLVAINSEASLNSDIYLMGYSQGGWATMSVLNELENTSSAFTPLAAACGAGAYNLLEMSEHVLALEEYGNPFYLPYFIESRRQNSILDNPLEYFFKEPYVSTIPALFDGQLCNVEMNSQFPKELDLLVSDDMINAFTTDEKYTDLKEELKGNSVEAWNTSAQIRLYHSMADNSVPYTLSENIYNDFVSKGAANKVEYIEADILDHNDAILPWGIDAITWLIRLDRAD